MWINLETWQNRLQWNNSRMGYYEQNSKSDLPPVKLNQLRWNSSCVLFSKQTHIRKNQYTRVNELLLNDLFQLNIK